MIDKLIHHHKVAGRDRLLHAARGADRDQSLHPKQLHAVDVRAIIEFARQKPMAAAVTGEKDHFGFAYPAAIIGVGGRAERGRQLDLLDQLQPRHLVKTATADYAKYRPRHALPCSTRPLNSLLDLRTTGRRRPRYPVRGSRESSRSSYPVAESLERLRLAIADSACSSRPRTD